MREAEPRQVLGFGGPHRPAARGSRVVMPNQVQAAVNDVQQQFVTGAPAVPGRLADGIVAADDISPSSECASPSLSCRKLSTSVG